MRYSQIRLETQDHIARVTLDRPEKRNPLGPGTIKELYHALETARDDPEQRVVLLTGAGKAFSAGGDLSQMGGGPGASSDLPPRSFVDLNLLFTRLGKPTIAMVNGPALGGGLGLVVACDLAVAAEEAVLGTPEIKVGLWPMMIMATIFRNVGRKAGMRLMLTGDKISATEAARIGLVSEVVPGAELEARTLELARALTARSPVVLRMGLAAFHATREMELEPALRHLEQQLAAVLGTEDAREGLMAFMQKREPRFKGY
jgi:enoyl-CoA hydratase/carnithine racemase